MGATDTGGEAAGSRALPRLVAGHPRRAVVTFGSRANSGGNHIVGQFLATLDDQASFASSGALVRKRCQPAVAQMVLATCAARDRATGR